MPLKMYVCATKIEEHRYIWGYIKLLKSLDIFLNLGFLGFRSTGAHGQRRNTVHFDKKRKKILAFKFKNTKNYILLCQM